MDSKGRDVCSTQWVDIVDVINCTGDHYAPRMQWLHLASLANYLTIEVVETALESTHVVRIC